MISTGRGSAGTRAAASVKATPKGRTAATGNDTANGGASTAGPATPANRPVVVLVAAAVQAIEVVGILIATVLAGIDVAEHKAYLQNSGVAITAIGAGAVLALGLVAVGLYRMRRWSRTPALLTQLFVGIVGIYLVQAPRLDWGIPALVLAVAGFVALLSPVGLRTLAPGHRG